ncbi:antitoxin VbhA family protein [Achromobacter sp. ACM03]|uniref:antitoxin VbhA family protein n=1 Tax=Achromobacter sp. ACM03 TaxID=2769300 RepID=UPI00177C36A0|nr:antitoxin VbhA family protein [Achromobacter sp. ACM03]MBD9430432.1 antitoxin VbhA family protein [Achromobacter sp. ACM03]
MAGKGKYRQQPQKIISGTERSRRQPAANYVRASVGLEGFSLSEADEAHAQRFIDGQISLQEFVQPRADALTLPKSSS